MEILGFSAGTFFVLLIAAFILNKIGEAESDRNYKRIRTAKEEQRRIDAERRLQEEQQRKEDLEHELEAERPWWSH